MPETSEKQPLFSILTVTRNALPDLKHTAESIKNQTCTDFEWIIIDGASTDGTAEYLETADADWISEPDSGIYNAMNKALSRARGQYTLFLNAGDTLYAPDTLNRLKSATTQNPDFIYGGSYEDGHHKPARTPDITRGMFTHHQAMLYARNTLTDMIFNEDYKIASDYDFTARFLSRIQNIHYHPDSICNFQSGGISQKNIQLGRQEQYQIRKNLELCSAPTNIAITLAQTACYQLRRFAPSLYWLLKSSRNTAPAKSQS